MVREMLHRGIPPSEVLKTIVFILKKVNGSYPPSDFKNFRWYFIDPLMGMDEIPPSSKEMINSTDELDPIQIKDGKVIVSTPIRPDLFTEEFVGEFLRRISDFYFDRKDLLQEMEKAEKSSPSGMYDETRAIWRAAHFLAIVKAMVNGEIKSSQDLYLEAQKLRNFYKKKGTFVAVNLFDEKSNITEMGDFDHHYHRFLFLVKEEVLTHNDGVLKTLGLKSPPCERDNVLPLETRYLRDIAGRVTFKSLNPNQKHMIFKEMPLYNRQGLTFGNLFFLLSDGQVVDSGEQYIEFFVSPHIPKPGVKVIKFTESCVGCMSDDGHRLCVSCIRALEQLRSGEKVENLSKEKSGDCKSESCLKRLDEPSKSNKWDLCANCELKQLGTDWTGVQEIFLDMVADENYEEFLRNLERVRGFIERNGVNMHSLTKSSRKK